MLDDDCPVVLMDKFDGVFNRDDLGSSFLIHQIDHVIKCRCLACPGWAGDKDKAIGTPREIIDFLWEAKLLSTGDTLATKAKTILRKSVSSIDGDSCPSNGSVPERDAQFPISIKT